MANYSWDFIGNTTQYMRGLSNQTGAYAQGIQKGSNAMTMAAQTKKLREAEAAQRAAFQNQSAYANQDTGYDDSGNPDLTKFGLLKDDMDPLHKQKAMDQWNSIYGGMGGINDAAIPSNIKQWIPLIQQAASKFGIPANNIAAIMTMESGGKAGARSVQGATGLMQIMPFHASAGQNLYDPKTNIEMGAKILKDNYNKYGDWGKAAAAYLGAVDSRGNPTYATDALGTSGVAYATQFKNLASKYAGLVNGANNLLQKGQKYLGTPYEWGGGRNGDAASGMDCSAFTSQVYKEFTGGKVNLTPYTDAQFDETYAISQPRVGDLVFYEGEGQEGTRFPHVAIYAGGNMVLDASVRSKGGVQFRPLQISGLSYIFRRPYGV